MFAIFMIVLTFFLVLSFIIQPLFSKTPNRPKMNTGPSDILRLRKEVVYEQIKEADMEFEMGNLSKEDFERTRNQLKEEASQIIGEIRGKRGK